MHFIYWNQLQVVFVVVVVFDVLEAIRLFDPSNHISVPSSSLAIQYQPTHHLRASALNPFVCSSVCQDRTFHLPSYTQQERKYLWCVIKLPLLMEGLRRSLKQLSKSRCGFAPSEAWPLDLSWTPAHHPSFPSKIWALTHPEAVRSAKRYVMCLIQCANSSSCFLQLSEQANKAAFMICVFYAFLYWVTTQWHHSWRRFCHFAECKTGNAK